MRVRSFLYENFDHAAHAAGGAAAGGPDGTMLAYEPHSRAEIDIVRREAFDAGRAQGVAEGRHAAREEAQVRLARDLPELLAGLGGAAAAMQAARTACERDALRLTEAALRQILPIVAARGLAREAAALVAEVVANVPAPVIEVRAAQPTRMVIERLCGELPPGVTLVADPELPEGSVRCTWAGGQAGFDGPAIIEQVLTILRGCLDRLDQEPAMPPKLQMED